MHVKCSEYRRHLVAGGGESADTVGAWKIFVSKIAFPSILLLGRFEAPFVLFDTPAKKVERLYK